MSFNQVLMHLAEIQTKAGGKTTTQTGTCDEKEKNREYNHSVQCVSSVLPECDAVDLEGISISPGGF